MKAALTKLFSPILNYFEPTKGEYIYRHSQRKVLLFIGIVSFTLSTISLIAAVILSQLAGLLSILLFFICACICLILGLLGSDQAVAKIWGNK